MNYERVIQTLLPILLQTLPPDYLKRLLDMLLDQIEDYVAKTPTKVDDLALVLTQMIRQQLDIPEYEDSKSSN